MHNAEQEHGKQRETLMRNRVSKRETGRATVLVMLFLAAAVGTVLVTWVLIVMFGRKQEARSPFVRLVEVSEISTDPAPWGLNWPHHYDGYIATAGDKFYGGSSALTQRGERAQASSIRSGTRLRRSDRSDIRWRHRMSSWPSIFAVH